MIDVRERIVVNATSIEVFPGGEQQLEVEVPTVVQGALSLRLIDYRRNVSTY
jgi:hypothetical protein